MILTVAHTKGGVGKTTISIQLATYLKAIKNVDKLLLIDGDPQLSTLDAISERNASKFAPINCAQYLTGKDLVGQLKSQSSLWTQIIIDVGARDNNTLRAALMYSDVLLIPVQPRGFDLQALRDLHTVMEDAWALDAHFKACAFLSMADAQGSSNEEAQQYIANYTDIIFLDCPVVRRKAYASSSLSGLSVFEETPRDQKACLEIENLAAALYNFEEK